jgi:hypothetical protein
MITAAEARKSGPIANYIAVSRALEAEIWRAIYARKTKTLMALPELARMCNAVYDGAWVDRLLDELEALGYDVSAEGIVSW